MGISEQYTHSEGPRPFYTLHHWEPKDASEIYRLEEQNWAPWLRKSEKDFAIIAEVFPEGQLLLRDVNHTIIATLRTNRMQWDGDSNHLPTWDAVAGGIRGEGLGMHVPKGNALCLMSMNVNPVLRSNGLASRLISDIKDVARDLGVSHLVGPFRPTGYGLFKVRNKIEGTEETFKSWCWDADENNIPVDPWLRTVTKYHNMHALRTESRSMTVVVSKKEFDQYRQIYNPENWFQLDSSGKRWECGEVGMWTVDDEGAIYTEPNLWGELPLATELHPK